MDYPNVPLWGVSHLLCLQQDCFSDPTLLNTPTAYTPPAALLQGLWHEEYLVSGQLQVSTAPSVGTAENGVDTPPHTVQGRSTRGQVLFALKLLEAGMALKAPV